MIELVFPRTGVHGFLILWVIAYGVFLAIYFGLGSILVALNTRHPERRIQDRIRSRRVRADISQSLVARLTISAYVAGGLITKGG